MSWRSRGARSHLYCTRTSLHDARQPAGAPIPHRPLKVAGTGLPGMRATDRLRYFASGASYPDFMVFGLDAGEAVFSDGSGGR